MTRPVIALVTGFTRSPDLCRRSLSPLCELLRRGVLDRIVAVTWDSAELDPFLEPFGDMPEIELVRLPVPDVTGGPCRRGTIYQIRNLEAALALLPQDEALILKWRPDFVADTGFIAEKITGFDTVCAQSTLHSLANMPKSPFKMKIWLPWADANQPFFYEDGVFMGLKSDVTKLADRAAEKHLGILDDETYGWFAHVVRFALPFLDSYPIFQRYLSDFHCFPNHADFRCEMLRTVQEDAFFWHLIVAHAWILSTNFHVDCGGAGQLALYPNFYNRDADWSRPQTLRVNPPYDRVDYWRQGQSPGGVLPGAGRIYGRLVDDSWQHALFTRDTLTDLTPETIREVLRIVTLYPSGVLDGAEDIFYHTLEQLWRSSTFRQVA